MHPPSTAEGHDTVSAEDALEHMSVEKAWHLLADLSSQVVRKQSELQLMVGSRYHELIESADSIVSMKEISTEVLGLLQSFPHACSNVLEQVPSSSTPSMDEIRGPGSDCGAPRTGLSEVVQLMLHAPAAMWAALDTNRVVEAASLLLRCRSGWATVSTSFSADVDSSLAGFLRSQVMYIEQFPHRIVLAGTRLLTCSCSTEETAGALAALLQLEAHMEADPVRCLLELLLRRRGGAVIAMLTRASKAAPRADVEDALRNAVVTVQKTIVDVHAIFAPGPNGRCMLVELAHLSSNGKGRLQMAAPDIKCLCTKWLSLLAPKIREFSKRLLGAAVDTNTLARIRGALWTITHGKCAWASKVPGKRRAREEVTDEILWTEAASFAVDVSALGGDAHPGGNTAAPRLDLWSLLFSNTFADLAEALLRESLFCIRQDVECRLDSILLAITGNHAGAGAQDGSNGLAAHSPRRPVALMAHDILAAADAVVSLLKSELRSLAGDAWCLTERDDKAAADALRTSFYLLCVEMAAGLANHLRTALEEIHDCIKSASQQERRGIPCEGGLRELEDTLGSFADAGLVIGRVAWMLNGRGGRSLSSALTAPACFAQRLRGRIEEQQLEAAFVIADTDGDGIVDAEEAAEALQAVSFGASAALVLDPSPYPSFTLSEFFLFATRLLEEQRPHVHLTTCLDDMLATSLTVWAEWALEHTATLLTEGCDALAALCGNPAMTDDAWRQAHGIWEDKTIELDRDDGDGIEETVHVPIMVSPAILCYIEGVAAELGRILSIADLVGPASVSEPQEAKAAKDGARTIGGVALGDSTGEGAARYARSLAAVRASSDLMHALVALCEGPQAPATQACEAALLQLLLDALFLQRWVVDADRFTSSMDSVVGTLSEMIDPINLQIYLPHLQTAAAACWAACHTPLSLIFQGVVAHCTAASGISMSPDGAVGSSSSFVALVPKARRFELLPLPLDVVRLQDANGSSRVGNSAGRKPGGAAEADGTGSSAQVRGMEAGRQALAGLMDQVGSVGSVLSAQNVKVQSVFGAASLFLGGRNRRGDGDEDRVF